jgi:hypothetical protein
MNFTSGFLGDAYEIKFDLNLCSTVNDSFFSAMGIAEEIFYSTLSFKLLWSVLIYLFFVRGFWVGSRMLL